MELHHISHSFLTNHTVYSSGNEGTAEKQEEGLAPRLNIALRCHRKFFVYELMN